jgi:hypothetical protein
LDRGHATQPSSQSERVKQLHHGGGHRVDIAHDGEAASGYQAHFVGGKVPVRPRFDAAELTTEMKGKIRTYLSNTHVPYGPEHEEYGLAIYAWE